MTEEAVTEEVIEEVTGATGVVTGEATEVVIEVTDEEDMVPPEAVIATTDLAPIRMMQTGGNLFPLCEILIS